MMVEANRTKQNLGFKTYFLQCFSQIFLNVKLDIYVQLFPGNIEEIVILSTSMITILELDDSLLLSIFHYLPVRCLGRYSQSCKRTYLFLNSSQAQWMWKMKYMELVHDSFHITIPNLDWRKRCIYFTNCLNFTNKSNRYIHQPDQITSPSNSPLLITQFIGHGLTIPRSGHTAHRIKFVSGREYVLLVAGSSHHFTFLSTFDILEVLPYGQLKTLGQQIKWSDGFDFIPRWLHAGITIENTVILFGGQPQPIEPDAHFYFITFLSETSIHTGVFQPRLSSHSTTYLTTPLPSQYLRIAALPPLQGCTMTLDPIQQYTTTDNIPYYRIILFGGKSIGNDIYHNMLYIVHLFMSDYTMECFQLLDSCCDCNACNCLNCNCKNNNKYSNNQKQFNSPLSSSSSFSTSSSLPPPSPRYCASATLVNRLLYIFGGWYRNFPTEEHYLLDSPQEMFYNDMHVFHIDLLQWQGIEVHGHLPSPRCQHDLIPISRKQLLKAHNNNYEEVEQQQEPKEFLLLFGGASRKDFSSSGGVEDQPEAPDVVVAAANGDNNEENTNEVVPIYGNIVIDLCDFHLFDLATNTWLDLRYEYPPSRGGCISSVETSHGWMFFGEIVWVFGFS